MRLNSSLFNDEQLRAQVFIHTNWYPILQELRTQHRYNLSRILETNLTGCVNRSRRAILPIRLITPDGWFAVSLLLP